MKPKLISKTESPFNFFEFHVTIIFPSTVFIDRRGRVSHWENVSVTKLQELARIARQKGIIVTPRGIGYSFWR